MTTTNPGSATAIFPNLVTPDLSWPVAVLVRGPTERRSGSAMTSR